MEDKLNLPEKLQTELLMQSIVGGLMGEYLEENLPFYFINEKMVSHLGYDNEEDFVKAIAGYVVNSIHPEDRGYVVETIKKQIAEKNEYSVEYRMLKKDGSYIWVHSLGKKHITDEGKTAIISVCHDVTKEHNRNKEFESIVDTLKGGVATFEIVNGKFVPSYLSDGVSTLVGMNTQEYIKCYGDDISRCIYKPDLKNVAMAVHSALDDNKVSSVVYRSPHVDEGYVWLSGVFSKMESPSGKTLLRAVFTQAPQQFETQLNILNSTATGVYIINSETYELYYANEPAFNMFEKKSIDYIGKKCYEVMHNGTEPCGFCEMRKSLESGEERVFTDKKHNNIFSIKTKKTIWNNRPSVILYLSDITQTKEIESKLRQSEEMSESASSFAGIWMWVYNIKENTAICYKKLQEDFGIPAVVENYPQKWLEYNIIVPQHRELYRSKVMEIKNGAEQVEFDCQLRYRDGNDHWIRCRLNRIKGSENGEELAVCTAQSIDVEKELKNRIELEQQKPLLNQNNLLSHVSVNLTKDTVEEYKITNSVVDVCDRPVNYEASVMEVAKYIDGHENQEKFREIHRRKNLLDFYKSGGSTRTMEFKCNMIDGRTLWTRIVQDVLMNPTTGNIFYYEYFYNIDTEKKEQLAIDSLLEEEIEFTVLVDVKSQRGHLVQSKNAIDTEEIKKDFDYETIISKLSRRIAEGKEKERWTEFFNIKNLIGKLENEKSVSITYKITEGNKESRKKANAFYLDEAKDSIVIARRDITDIYIEEQMKKKALQMAVDAANAANSAKSSFLAQMSHEIRTPMNAIIGMTKLAEDESNNPIVQEYLQNIDSSSEYLLGLLNDVLDMSRIESGKLELNPQWINAGKLVESCINMIRLVANAKGINFIYPDSSRVTHIEYYVDSMRTKQILMNLLNNALKFTERGGTVSLRAKNVFHDGKISKECLIIEDTGCGMSEEFLKRIFKPFEQERNPFSDKVRGTGLGLALVKNIVEKMEGTIEVESKIGVGSKFTITIPMEYRLCKKIDAKEKTTESLTDIKGKRVLLVDDHPLNREIAKKLLEKKDVIVEIARDGQEAVDSFTASKEGYYDAVLMDIRMPVLNGLEATEQIRALARPDANTVPIIAMTANAFDEDVNKSLNAGMNAHLAKPINPNLLYETLSKWIK